MAPAVPTYAPRDPSRTVLYTVVAEHLKTCLALGNDDPEATGLPAYVQRAFYDDLQCGMLAHGLLRLGCDPWHHELLVPFSCKRRGFCPSCAARRMAQMAAHLVEQVIPWVAHAPMGRLGTNPLAVLDGVLAGPHGQGPYHHAHHDRAV